MPRSCSRDHGRKGSRYHSSSRSRGKSRSSDRKRDDSRYTHRARSRRDRDRADSRDRHYRGRDRLDHGRNRTDERYHERDHKFRDSGRSSSDRRDRKVESASGGQEASAAHARNVQSTVPSIACPTPPSGGSAAPAAMPVAVTPTTLQNGQPLISMEQMGQYLTMMGRRVQSIHQIVPKTAAPTPRSIPTGPKPKFIQAAGSSLSVPSREVKGEILKALKASSPEVPAPEALEQMQIHTTGAASKANTYVPPKKGAEVGQTTQKPDVTAKAIIAKAVIPSAVIAGPRPPATAPPWAMLARTQRKQEGNQPLKNPLAVRDALGASRGSQQLQKSEASVQGDQAAEESQGSWNGWSWTRSWDSTWQWDGSGSNSWWEGAWREQDWAPTAWGAKPWWQNEKPPSPAQEVAISKDIIENAKELLKQEKKDKKDKKKDKKDKKDKKAKDEKADKKEKKFKRDVPETLSSQETRLPDTPDSPSTAASPSLLASKPPNTQFKKHSPQTTPSKHTASELLGASTPDTKKIRMVSSPTGPMLDSSMKVRAARDEAHAKAKAKAKVKAKPKATSRQPSAMDYLMKRTSSVAKATGFFSKVEKAPLDLRAPAQVKEDTEVPPTQESQRTFQDNDNQSDDSDISFEEELSAPAVNCIDISDY